MFSEAELSAILSEHQITAQSITDDEGESYTCSCGFTIDIGRDALVGDRLAAHLHRTGARRTIAEHVASHFVSPEEGADYLARQMSCGNCRHPLEMHEPNFGLCLDPGCHEGREQCRRKPDNRGSVIPLWPQS